MKKSLYLQLTQEFNSGRVRAILSSGQAVVFYKLAVMSKDGDWLIREDQESLDFLLKLLEQKKATYRFGAPLDLRWLQGGWSSHFEYREQDLRIRVDLVSRPPRISEHELLQLWKRAETQLPAVVDPLTLCTLKKTMREKDYPVIGELARQYLPPEDALLTSRSALDLITLAEQYPDAFKAMLPKREVLSFVLSRQIDQIEASLDAERRLLMKSDRARMEAYVTAALQWRELWPNIESQTNELPLHKAHRLIIKRADGILPFKVSYED